MEDLDKKNGMIKSDKEIVYSKAIKAGQRIYYLDVKRNRREELFLSITESKKVISGEGDEARVNFEKHKIFLYKTDFEKFVGGLLDVISFINEMEKAEGSELDVFEAESDEVVPEVEFAGVLNTQTLGGEINIDIEFE